ncbi:hypothetical protein ABZW18_02995 [Streptomyces sp. NPDC004647]|uniref:hypothetical protein n=1 Tax=Streptomyces sp. NPDC004647 TaxID=3154671 RepID=UPI0033B04C31
MPPSKKETPKKEDTPRPNAPDEDSVFNDGRADVTIKSCRIGDPYGLGDRLAVADFEIRNASSKVSDYLIQIEVTDPATGDRKETLTSVVTELAPGQSVDTGNGDGEEDASGTNNTLTGPIRCNVLSADRVASVE